MVGAIRAPHIGHIPRHGPPNIAAPRARLTIDRRMHRVARVEPAAWLEREHEVERIRAALCAVGHDG
jgi:hypothetical protein